MINKSEVYKQFNARMASTPVAIPAKPATLVSMSGPVFDTLCGSGTLAQSLPGYQQRDAQIIMALTIERAIREGKSSIIEAPTGTGKSLAYLIPAALDTQEQVHVVATANKALQDQLWYKDIPFVQKYVKPSLKAAILKGAGNYVCLQRMNEYAGNWQNDRQDATYDRLADEIAENESFNGDFDTLRFTVSPHVREHVATDTDECAGKHCSLYDTCYRYKAMKQAREANIIITNHDLLLLDAVTGHRILPAYDNVVLDEAHNLEEKARGAFSTEFKVSRVRSFLRLKRLHQYSSPLARQATEQQLAIVKDTLATIALQHEGQSIIQLTSPLEDGLMLASLLDAIILELEGHDTDDMEGKEKMLFMKLVERAKTLTRDVRGVFSVADSNCVYTLARDEKNTREVVYIVKETPLDVSDVLDNLILSKFPVQAVSATIATGGPAERNPFSFYQKTTGANRDGQALTQMLSSVFDYRKNAVLYVPSDLPAPTFGGKEQQQYEAATAKRMLQLVQASRGRAFLLFASKRMLEYTYATIAPLLAGYELLVQGEGGKLQMVQRFKEGHQPVLFGLKTFWEGVDIPGKELSLVCIDKLPFPYGDDPITKARENQVNAAAMAGQPWFGEYVVPQIIIALKQGVGRLLRDIDDQGVMAILDSRLHSKGYGRRIMAAMPPARRTQRIDDVQAFFEKH